MPESSKAPTRSAQNPHPKAFATHIDKDLDPFSPVKAYNTMLEDFRNHMADQSYDEDYAYLYPRLVSYRNRKSKQYWISKNLVGAHDRGFFRDLWATSGRVHTRTGVFATWSETPISTNVPWADQKGHFWGAALVNDPSNLGKHLFIWDSNGRGDWDPEARPRDVLIGAQQTLLSIVRAEFLLCSLWYSGHEESRGDCLKRTADWVFSVASEPDLPCRPNDPRFEQFKQIHKLA
ncbi:MAG: hypothetical protein L6R36_002440 [Xanthoria steineri]|nr:MAG: hypothetical protein L6R36_002440 [Xanthoria steineri]